MSSNISKYFRRHALTIIANIAVVGSLTALTLLFFREFTSSSAHAIAAGLVASLLGILGAFAFARISKLIIHQEPVVFISYTHKDKEFVFKLVDEMMRMNVRPLFDQIELKVGDSIKAVIEDMIDRSDFFAYVVSTNSAESDWAKKEIEQAVKMNKKILPIVIDPNSIPEELSGLYYADFSKDFDKGIYQLRSTFD